MTPSAVKPQSAKPTANKWRWARVVDVLSSRRLELFESPGAADNCRYLERSLNNQERAAYDAAVELLDRMLADEKVA